MNEETIVQENAEQLPELSPAEQEASGQGWVPKEEFTGDPVKWVDAGEFLRRGELFKKIDQVSKTAKRAEQTLAEFKTHYAKVKETEYNNALATLKAERRAAMVNGDFENVERIEEQIETTKTEATRVKEEVSKTTEVPEVHPEVATWVENNPWYNTDMKMKAYADAAAAELNRQGIRGADLLKGIDKEVRQAFPTKFSNPRRDRPGAVESSTSQGSTRSSDFQLNEQETRIMNTFVRDGVMTREEYIKDLKQIKGIK